MNKAHPTKLLEQRYDAVDREVTLGTSYDRCIWYLEKLCGGVSYQDVTKHKMVLQSDCYYKCSSCGYRVKSRVLQDKEILSHEEYLKVIALMTSYSYYADLHITNNHSYMMTEYKDIANRILDEINNIRSKNDYKGKYEYCDGNHDYIKVPYDFPVAPIGNIMSVSYTKITKGNIIFYNGVFDGVVALIAGYCIAKQYGTAIATLVQKVHSSWDSDKPTDNIGAFLSAMADSAGQKEFAFLIDLGASADQEMQEGDEVINIKYGMEPSFNSRIVFAPDGTIRSIDHGINQTVIIA